MGPFNIGNPGEFTMVELAELVQEVVSELEGSEIPEISYQENTSDDPKQRKVSL